MFRNINQKKFDDEFYSNVAMLESIDDAEDHGFIIDLDKILVVINHTYFYDGSFINNNIIINCLRFLDRKCYYYDKYEVAWKYCHVPDVVSCLKVKPLSFIEKMYLTPEIYIIPVSKKKHVHYSRPQYNLNDRLQFILQVMSYLFYSSTLSFLFLTPITSTLPGFISSIVCGSLFIIGTNRYIKAGAFIIIMKLRSPHVYHFIFK